MLQDLKSWKKKQKTTQKSSYIFNKFNLYLPHLKKHKT
jgi:hypothetical protein